MKRLSHQIYLTILLCLVVVVILAGVFWRRASDYGPARQAFALVGELAQDSLPPASAPPSKQAAALKELGEKLDLRLSLYSRNGELLGQTGRQIPAPDPGQKRSGFIWRRGGPTWAVVLPDGRALMVRYAHRHLHRKRFLHPALRLIAVLGLIALIVSIIAWPVVRGLTRRLEKLQTGVEKFGAGELSTRVEVKGRDEIAQLAKSFNASAERIEDLMRSQKMLLANSSHELRTPLSRIRLGIERLKESADPERRAALEQDISELDSLIEEILLLSKLDALDNLELREDVDLLALAAEEASRFNGASATGTPLVIKGDARLLRRLVRNLIDNAIKHGKAPVEVTVKRKSGTAVLSVTDNGPGFEADEVKQAFEPFQRGPNRGRIGGSGLGLALVQQIAKRHGGSVRITKGNDNGRLNQVVVILPI